MKNKIITIAIVSATLFLSQRMEVFAAIAPSEIITLVNQERVQADLSSLTENALLNEAAQAKADDMAMEHYFSHTSPKDITPWDWFRKSKYEYRYAGENLAIHFRDAALEQRAWMESKKHCENIMSPKYREIGVAVREMEWEGKKTTIAVQMFGTQMSDEKELNLSQRGSASCPKTYPSVLGTSLPTDTGGGLISAAMGFLSETAVQFKIDTFRLLVLMVIAFAQIAGLFTVLSLSMQKKWQLRW